MKHRSKLRKTVLALGLGTALLSGPVFAQAGAKPPTRPAAATAPAAEPATSPTFCSSWATTSAGCSRASTIAA